MADRLSPLDVSFLYMESTSTPMHVGAVAIFEVPEGGFDYERLVALIEERISLVPRYRQRVKWVPGRIASPVWIDDENFDAAYHVRRSALPKPGTEGQLRELVARIMARPLDRSRPLWEMYLVEGLQGGHFAVLTKTHHAMVDGVAAVDIAQVILDSTPSPRRTVVEPWKPVKEPSGITMVASALSDVVRRPASIVGAARSGLEDFERIVAQIGTFASGVASAAWTVARPAAGSALNAPIGEARRFATADTPLEDYKKIRRAHGGTINDVVLAVVAGGLRAWLMTRGESVTSRTTIRALVPVSVRPPADGSDDGALSGNRIAAILVDLPVGEAAPVMRLQRVSFEMAAHKESGQLLGADALVSLAGFAPSTIHSLGSRAASGLSRRVFNVVVTNVPGPQYPLYAGGARMLAAYPVVPLAKGQAVSIGLTSYDGGIYFGLNADRDAMPDLDVLAQCLADSLAELLATVDTKARRRSRPKLLPE